MSTLLAPVAIQQFKDNNGNPLVGGQLYTYQAGTSIPAPSYTDATGTSANTNPVILNSRGEAPIWLTPGQFYKLVLQDAASVMIWTADQVPGGFVDAALLPDTASSNKLRADLILTSDPTRGGSLVGFIGAGAGAVGRTVQSRLREIVSLKDFGAMGDGVTNDDTAITMWLALAGSGVTLYAPAGTYLFNSAKTITAANNIKIRGEGRQKTKFIYTGINATNDIWTVGNGSTTFNSMHLEGFNIDSTTTMTAGTGLRIKFQQNGSLVKDVSFSNLNAPLKLWDGIWFDNTNVTDYVGFEVNVQNEGVVVSGSATVDTGSDLFLDQGTVLNANVGVHCGGGFGGLYVGKVLCYGNLTNYLVDNARAARLNRELMYSGFAISDGCKNYGFYINDTLANGSNITLNAFIGSAGKVGAGGIGINVKVASYPNSRITIGSGQIFNATGDGINISDATTLVTIGSATQVNNNNGVGINATVATNNVSYSCDFAGNNGGNVGGNVRKTYTPNITTSTGTIASFSGSVVWTRSGTTAFVSVLINIITNGTGAGAVGCTLPFTVRSAGVLTGRATSVSGKTLQGFAGQNGQSISILNYDGTYPAVNGETFVLSGCLDVY